MVFSTTSKNIYLRWEDFIFLCATCKVGDEDRWQYSEVNIDENIWFTSDWKFDISGGSSHINDLGLAYAMKPGTLQLQGTVIQGTLRDEMGGHELSLCLDLYITNDKGSLKWELPPNDIYSSVVGAKLDPKTAVLSGYCLGNDGQLHYSELPLDDHIGVDNGIIKREKNGHFLSSGKAINVSLSTDWWVVADIKFNDGRWNPSCGIEFGKYVHVEDGKFVMDDPPGLFDLRGPIMRFLEDMPLVGYGIAGIDALEGDDDEAKRAVAECTYSTLVTVGAVVGFALTGPIGASIGSAFGTMLGLEARAGIGLSINDPNMRNQVASISVFQMLTAVASLALALPIDMVVAGLTEALTEGVFEEGIVQRALQTAISGGDEALGVFGLKSVGQDEVKEILGKIVDLIQDDLAQGKSNEEIAADISKLYDDDGGDGTNPLNDTTLWVKKAVKAAANKAFEDGGAQVNNATRNTPHDAAQSALQKAVQEATQAAARELGQEAAQELVNTVQQSEGSNIETNVDLYVVSPRVANILLAADFPWGEMPLAGDDPTVAFMEGLPAIKKALKDATQYVKDSVALMEDQLEEAKNTAQRPFQGNADDAATAAQKLEHHIASLVSNIRSEGNYSGAGAIQVATEQIDEAMQKAVQDATQVIKQEAEDWARVDAESGVKDAVHKAVQKVKDAEKEVQATIHDAMLGTTGILSMAFDTLVQAAGDLKWTGSLDDIEPAVQGAVPGAVQDAKQSIQNIADTALQKALQELQAGPEVQKHVRKAAQDATEYEVSKIPKMVQDCVPDAVKAAEKEYNRVAGEDPRPPSHSMQPGGVKPV